MKKFLSPDGRYEIEEKDDLFCLRIEKDGTYSFPELKKDLAIEIARNLNVVLITDNRIGKMKVAIGEDATVEHEFIRDEVGGTFFLAAVVSTRATYSLLDIDLSDEDANVSYEITLNGFAAHSSYAGGIFSSGTNKKNYETKIVNAAQKTEGYIDTRGVVDESSSLRFIGRGVINQGAKQAIAKQKCDLLLLANTAQAIGEPILEIDENDVEASHANAVGAVPDDVLFYLSSRGLSFESVRRIMVFSYAQPLVEQLRDENIKRRLEAKLERRFDKK